MKRYTREDHNPFIGDGHSAHPIDALPNPKDVDPLYFLNDLAARGHMMTPEWGYALLPDGSRRQWTQFFLFGDGTGYAVTYASTAPIVRKFQICEHEFVMGPGANPERGWRPGSCKHCGMDMSVDSGD